MDALASFRSEAILQWVAVAFYAGAAVAYTVHATFGREDAASWGGRLALSGMLPHSAALALRWVDAGHGPYMTRHEVLSSNSWVAVLVFLFAAWRLPRLRAAGLVVMPFCLLTMAVGLMLDPRIRRLPPSLRGIWLVFHILFAKLAAGGVLLALGAAALFLLRERRPEADFSRRLPPLEVLDAYSRRFASFGFVFWSVMIAAGAIWANEAWGRYWSWDPIETWSLVTWLSLGAYLHLRRFHGWSGRRAAVLLAACFALSMGTLLAVPLLVKTLHGEYFQ